ncbi:MAG: hypothetical protein M1814_006743 [Vezdaea aestivalis]|nr:MAG: hypothetical protein M1814_006743 [Vezdaea aestivalis]
MVVPAIPEIYDDSLQVSIEARTDALQTLRELGPPDLVHLVKQASKSQSKISIKVGVYHHVTGVDASSSASLAAYVNTLVHSPHEKGTKVVSGLYCCFNAFSRLDMRVQVNIPGTLESFCVDERGEKQATTEEMWLEAYLCGILRAYSYADDGGGDNIKKIMGMRRFNPITSTEAEQKFLNAAERLFFKGWQLGSSPDVQVPNLVTNHLTAGLLHYINTTGRYASGINLFEKLRARDVEISSLLAQVLIAADEEVRAVALLHEAIEILPMDYSLLDVQASYLMSKGRYDLARDCAKRAVVAAPSEFRTWSRLAEIYVATEEWELALLTLNSCPMFTYQDRDAPNLPPPSRANLPVLSDSLLDEINDDSVDELEVIHPNLRKLPGSTYGGTFKRAYSLLTQISKKIGWDQLLRLRSGIFVMEEEYRTERTAKIAQYKHSRTASTTALHSPSPVPVQNGEAKNVDGEVSQPSSDSSPSTPAEAPESATTSGQGVDSFKTGEAIEKPELTVSSQEVKGNKEETDPSQQPYIQFRNKRLCERWFDNLFSVLYEDLRIYTIWQSELAQFQSTYTKSAEEWDILASLAQRLNHHEEAAQGWVLCLKTRFSPKAMKGMLDTAMAEGDTRKTIHALIRLVAWQYRWYSEFSPELLQTTRTLIEDQGGVKIRSIVQATSLPQPVLDLTHHYASLCATFGSHGSDG